MVKGLIRFVQVDKDKMVIDGTIDGLTPGKHALCMHECGDISDGCDRLNKILIFVCLLIWFLRQF
jgi:copper chaperone for superoxide dismutase